MSLAKHENSLIVENISLRKRRGKMIFKNVTTI